MGIFDELFNSSGGEEAARNAAAARTTGLNTGLTNANSALDTGFGQSREFFDRASVPFTDLLRRGNAGYDTYLDATGVNGAGGISRAGDLFKSMPGYRGGLDTGIDLLERRANARGMLSGGNTSADTIKYASDYDAGKYKDFLSSLLPNIGVAQGATSGTAGILGQQGAMANDLGRTKADYGYRAATGAGEAEAGGIQQAQQARNQASQNFWNALGGAASLAVSAATGMPMPRGGGGGSTGGYNTSSTGGGNPFPSSFYG